MKTLLETHRVENITVQMILEQSGVSRASFYRAFSDKYDLMYSYFLDFLQEQLKEASPSLYKLTFASLQFICENKAYFTNMVKYDGQNSFSSTFYEYLYTCACSRTTTIKARELTEAELTAIELYCSGAVFCTEKWITKGMKQPPEKFAEILTGCLPSSLK